MVKRFLCSWRTIALVGSKRFEQHSLTQTSNIEEQTACSDCVTFINMDHLLMFYIFRKIMRTLPGEASAQKILKM